MDFNWKFGHQSPSGRGYVTSKKTGHSMPMEYHPLFAMLGVGGGGGSSSGSSGRNRDNDTPAAPPPAAGPAYTWSFPQYSQTWAFTPPAGPQTYAAPPKFDPKSETGYASPPRTTALPTPRNSRTRAPFSITDLMGRYK
jgi:hypothetical protein